MVQEGGPGGGVEGSTISAGSVAARTMREASGLGRMGDGGGGSGLGGAGGMSFGAVLGVGVGGGVLGAERGGAAGISRIAQLAGNQRQRLQQRKHPEPLRRAVAHCLSASYNATASAFTSEAVRTLQDYLANSSTMDSAYIVLLEHATAERDRSPPVITKCVALLKRYLFRYVPRPNTLEQIAAFCEGLIAECQAAGFTAGKRTTQLPASEQATSSSQGTPGFPSATTLPFASAALVKSLLYVRALLARCFSNYPYHASNNITSSAKPSKPALPSPRTRPFTSPYDRGLKRAVPDDREAVKSAAMCISGLEEIDDEDGDYIAVDVMKWRWLGGKGQQSWAPSPVMMDSGGIARPHVERMQNLAEQGASALMLKSIQQKESENQGRSSLEGLVEQILLPTAVTAVNDRLAVRSHLRAVAAAKRHKAHTSQRWDGDGPPSTLRRRARPLFQYRHYSEQQPLRLSDAEMEEVITAVCSEIAGSSGNTLALVPALPNSQAGKLAPEAADVAASVLIKLLIDMYIADPRTAAPLALSMVQGMLTSPSPSVRVRAFDLTLNLGVHAHLLEPMQSEDQTTPEEGATSEAPSVENGSFSSFGSLPGFNRISDRHRKNKSHLDASSENFLEKPERGTPPAVGRFEAWLLDILCEMLLLLVQAEEADEGVWAAALSCLLYLVCDRGRIQRRRLDGVDIRALKYLLEISWEYGWADEVHCRLVRIACNLVYRLPFSTDDSMTSKLTLDLQQIELMGGIETICDEYARAKTLEAKRNLFAVLFDFILSELEEEAVSCQKQFPGIEEIQAVATALCLAEAPECYALAFKQGLPGVGEALSKSITTAMARDVTSGRLNGQLLEEVVGALDKLAGGYAHPEDEFMELLPLTLASDGLNNDSIKMGESQVMPQSTLVTKAWATLEFLLHSPRPCYRCNGYVWLLELLQAEMARGSSKSSKLNTNALQRQLGLLGNLEKPAAENETPESEKTDEQTPTRSSAVKLMCGLLKSKRPSIRRGFVVILERVLLLCQRYGCDLELNLSTVADGEVAKPEGVKSMGPQDRALAMLGLMNGALWQAISANDTDRVNILQMCNMMFSQLCVSWPLPSNGSNRNLSTSGRGDTLLNNYGSQREGGNDGIRNISNASSGGSRSCSMASMLLNGQAAAPKLLVANMPTPVLYWPLMQLAGAATEDVTLGVAVGSRGGGNVPGGACDVRAALLLILIGKCTTYHATLGEVGGEEFFRSLLDDMDARVAYYTSAFLLKRMMTEEPEKYQRMLHNLVFKAQQSNNEKILENPYLQMRGILQLSSEGGSSSFQLDS